MWQDVNIATKELLLILLAVAIRGVFWRGNQILVQCDNMAIVQIIAANTSTDAIIMHLLRGLHFFSAYYSINLRAVHIPGSVNICADAISRNLLQVFFRENPHARRYPTPIPEYLCDVLVRTQPDWRSGSWRGLLATSLRLASRIAQEDPTLQGSQPISPSICHRLNLAPLPAAEQQLILFTADMSQRLSFATIRTYLSAVHCCIFD